MTVKELHEECAKLIDSGLGDKEIMISNDDEGNGYHNLFYSFMTDENDIKCAMEFVSPWDAKDAKDVVILG